MNSVNHNKFQSFKVTFFIYIYFFIHIKLPKNLSAKYYHRKIERLLKKRYQNLSKEEKEKKR